MLRGVAPPDDLLRVEVVDGDNAMSHGAPLLRASAGAIGERLAALAAISSGSGPGITRLAYTPEERSAHALVGSWWRALGASVRIDAAGNTIAELPGTAGGGRALGTGSHLDTVVDGGAYDGAAGVVAATELLRIFAERPLRHPLRCVAFAGEEAARFGRSCIGSSLATGALGTDDLLTLVDADGCDLATAMSDVDLPATAAAGFQWDMAEWLAFLELHVEQGGELERRGLGVGVVDVVSGSVRLELQIRGVATHSGGAPMGHRSDALTAAAEVILLAERLATARSEETRATVGTLDVHPGGITTIPGYVRALVDIRDTDCARQTALSDAILAGAAEICRRRGVALTPAVLGETPPVALSPVVRAALTEAIDACALTGTTIASGAGHDAQVLALAMPAGMLFVPSRRGLSHVAEESSDPKAIAVGVDVCARALLRLDELTVE